MVQTTEVLPENLGEVLGQVLNVEASDQSFLAIDTETAWSDPHTDRLKLRAEPVTPANAPRWVRLGLLVERAGRAG